MEQLKEEQRYTYRDYVQWEGDERWELIDGVPYMMAAPRVNHQRIAGRAYSLFLDGLRGKTCEPFISPIDVRLNHDTGDDTVVQPDVIVVCDPNKITENTINGAPDLVIEVLSPSTSRKDRWFKYISYQQAGVKEYWIIDPENRSVEVYVLQDAQYRKDHVYDSEGIIKTTLFEELEIAVIDIFEA